MNFLYKMERKLGKYAIPNLITYLIGAYAFGIALYFIAPKALEYLTLEPYYILKGQVWRLISWIFIPSSISIFTIIMLLFYYSIGRQLELYWGAFRFNLYIFGALIFTDIAAMILYGVLLKIYGMAMPLSGYFSTSYINLSLFLAFAVCFPEMEVRLYFLIPVKMKWMAVVYGVIIAYEVVTSGWVVRTAIIASLLNFIIFYLLTRNYKSISPKEIHRKKKFHQQVKTSTQKTKHKCAICGRTEDDDPTLQFRYCSKCAGNHEYCQDHLFTHKHITF
ncbi:MAG: hypothetical protein K6A30_06670 [Lachnospiraceae bacterium]|nr:hypothetical protein [Lachnospiraceae bacterium]